MGFKAGVISFTNKLLSVLFYQPIGNFRTRNAIEKLIAVFFVFILLVFVWATIGAIARAWDFRDNDPARGALVVSKDPLGDRVDEITYLDQGWQPADSLWFYNVSQGSNLIPYDFFLVLEQKESRELFRNNQNILRYRYLPQKPTATNPDGLPLGMALDTYKGKRYMGYTCAACHTTQINYQGVGMRIDGGPAMADMENFMVDLAAAMEQTLEDQAKLDRFVAAVSEFDDYSEREEILADLQKFALRVESYTIINSPRTSTRPLTTYGYARLDAFGRIYNRVLEHLVTPETLLDAMSRAFTPAEYALVFAEVEPILNGEEHDHLIERIRSAPSLSGDDQTSLKRLVKLRDEIFNPADAPVSYPFLWDIPQHDYVQWNGAVGNAGIGPIGRNAGQVIGVFGTLDWQKKKGVTLSSVLGGQGFDNPHIEFDSSVNIRNVRRVENQLRDLYSPKWPGAIENLTDWPEGKPVLPTIDIAKAEKGEVLFRSYCEGCHENINRTSPDRRVVARMTGLEKMKTDAKAAKNSVEWSGYSGIVKGKYVDAGVGKILLERKAPAVSLLTISTTNVVTTPDPDKIFIQRWAERLFDFAITFFDNEVKASIKEGNYDPDSTVKPLQSLLAYKGRSLNGIWATAPYLHNGSVPTLYHLLLPKKRPGDPDDGSYRPDEFIVGSREFDPKYVGLKWDGYDGFLFRTDIYGNGNGGHEYAAGHTPQLNGKVLPALNKDQRWQLVEYLKTL